MGGLALFELLRQKSLVVLAGPERSPDVSRLSWAARQDEDNHF